MPPELDAFVLVVLVDVVVVEVVCAAAFSAAVLDGGTIAGVLLGTATDTVLPPHELSAEAARSAAHTQARSGHGRLPGAPGAAARPMRRAC